MTETEKSSDNFSERQIAGQRLMVGFDGTRLNSDLEFLIGTLNVGGIILFSRNITSPDQIRELSSDIQAYAASCGNPALFMAIDQEGGTVARLKAPFTLFPEGNPGIKTIEDAIRFAKTTAQEMREAGLNMNMAPVLDVEPEGFKGIMHERVFRGDSHTVADFGRVVIETFQENGIMAVGKHFPGIGRTTLDSHLELPFLKTSFKELEETDLVPFKQAIEKYVDGIMLSHILYEGIDPLWPASLSEKIAKHLLRDVMGYDGLILTDDLDMKAIRHDIPTQIRQIMAADIDIVLICHKSPKIENAFNEIVYTITSSEKNMAKGMASLERILRLKRRFSVAANGFLA
ncbi:MAG: beta-N-acetylhexosaminidase [Proteobacteria bacterium]|nr:beta-N-acetylhexosaminidase [Pseudomonadota bacterium]